ncbi:MAG: hypothetical protein RDU24_15055 [Humidesulfovibrio sp.]|uniref:DUF6599 family protein n=1 Tax=Humidesulfovibrio sp. TaxID=2910988 RepID=UPI0027EE2BAA|nr:DUF6599 family protein [Humidesulfovibrio sp.]MDQ7836696.1 hypothetical protein [Humidesulfovibrio sp.]
MAGRKRDISTGQRLASRAVLAVLCALAAYLLLQQPRLNPAVVVSLRAPAPKAGASAPAPGPAATEPGAAAPAEAAAPGAKPASLASLLPDAVPGVKALASAESFNPTTLSDKINGKAELYLAAGFAAMACRSYQAGPGRVELFLYRMKSPDAAFAVFSGQRRPGAAQSALAKNAYFTENALFLTSGPNYLEVIGDRAGQRQALEALAKAVLDGLAPPAGAAAGEKPNAKPSADIAPPDLFPRPGLKADSIRLAVADAFGCQGLTNIYTAEYDASFGGAAGLLSRRKDAAEAKAQLALYRRFLTDNGFVEQTPPSAPVGAVVLALEGIGVEVLFTRGQWLAGVHEAPDLPTALKLAAAMDAALGEALKAKGAGK